MHFLTGKHFKVNADKTAFEYPRAKQNDFCFLQGILLHPNKADFVSFSTFLLNQKPVSAYLTLVSKTQNLNDKYSCGSHIWFTEDTNYLPPFTQSILLHSTKTFLSVTCSGNAMAAMTQREIHQWNVQGVWLKTDDMKVLCWWYANGELSYCVCTIFYSPSTAVTDPWVPLISMAFMKLTEWDEIAFYCARSLLWEKRANRPGGFICHSHLWLDWNEKLIPLRDRERVGPSPLWHFCMIYLLLFTSSNEEWSFEHSFLLMLVKLRAAIWIKQFETPPKRKWMISASRQKS